MIFQLKDVFGIVSQFVKQEQIHLFYQTQAKQHKNEKVYLMFNSRSHLVYQSAPLTQYPQFKVPITALADPYALELTRLFKFNLELIKDFQYKEQNPHDSSLILHRDKKEYDVTISRVNDKTLLYTLEFHKKKAKGKALKVGFSDQPTRTSMEKA